MESLLSNIEVLKRGPVGAAVRRRIAQFKKTGFGPKDGIFSELCFCICTANCSAERGIRAQKEIGRGFSDLPAAELKQKVRETVCRFYNGKTSYILAARSIREPLFWELSSGKRGPELRDWIVTNVRGLGYKEASHFLRNIGYGDVAIIDFHIIDLLEKHGLITRPRTLTKSAYLKMEEVLKRLASRAGLDQAALDLYLWYMETGKVLK